MKRKINWRIVREDIFGVLIVIVGVPTCPIWIPLFALWGGLEILYKRWTSP